MCVVKDCQRDRARREWVGSLLRMHAKMLSPICAVDGVGGRLLLRCCTACVDGASRVFARDASSQWPDNDVPQRAAMRLNWGLLTNPSAQPHGQSRKHLADPSSLHLQFGCLLRFLQRSWLTDFAALKRRVCARTHGGCTAQKILGPRLIPRRKEIKKILAALRRPLHPAGLSRAARCATPRWSFSSMASSSAEGLARLFLARLPTDEQPAAVDQVITDLHDRTKAGSVDIPSAFLSAELLKKCPEVSEPCERWSEQKSPSLPRC